MPEPTIVSHRPRRSNGLVLVAEEIPSVRSAAFTFLLPAGAAFEPEDRGGVAAMLAEWITRGAGDLDSRELIGASTPAWASPTPRGARRSAARDDLGRHARPQLLVPALSLAADVIRRPMLSIDEVEPIRAMRDAVAPGPRGWPRHEGCLRALRRRPYPDP